MGRTVGTNIVLALGVMSLLWSIIVLAAGLTYLIDPSSAGDNERGAQSVLYMCTPISFIVTAIILAVWWSRKKREDMAEEMASYLKMYRRVNLDVVAQRMGMSLRDAEKLLPECIAKGLVKGYLDRFSGEFIWDGAIDQMSAGGKCPGCGGSLDKVVLDGEVMKCSFCGSVIPPGTRRR